MRGRIRSRRRGLPEHLITFAITHTHIYGLTNTGVLVYISEMKTTLEISDSLLMRAKQLAREQKVTLRSLAEEGLRKVIEERSSRKPRKIKPVTFGGKGLSPEFAGAAWERIRDAAYPERGV